MTYPCPYVVVHESTGCYLQVVATSGAQFQALHQLHPRMMAWLSLRMTSAGPLLTVKSTAAPGL